MPIDNVDDLKQRIDYAIMLGRWALDQFANLPLKEESVAIGEKLQTLLSQWLDTAKGIARELPSAKQNPENENTFRQLIVEVQFAVSMPARESYDQLMRIQKFGHVGCVTTEGLRRELRSRLGA